MDAVSHTLHFIDEANPQMSQVQVKHLVGTGWSQNTGFHCFSLHHPSVSSLLSLQVTRTAQPVNLCCDSVSDNFPFTLPRPVPTGKMGVVNFDLCS